MQYPYLQRKLLRIQMISAIHEIPCSVASERNEYMFIWGYYLFIAESTPIENKISVELVIGDFAFGNDALIIQLLGIIREFYAKALYSCVNMNIKKPLYVMQSLYINKTLQLNSSGFLWRR